MLFSDEISQFNRRDILTLALDKHISETFFWLKQWNLVVTGSNLDIY